MGEGAECADLIRAIYGAELGRLRERHGRRLWRVHGHRIGVECSGERIRSELAVRACNGHDPRAAREELGRGAFIPHDVRLFVREHRAIRRTERRERQRIRRSAGGHGECGHFRAEESAEDRVEALRPLVVAVRFRMARIRFANCIEHFGTGSGRIVAVEAHAAAIMPRCSYTRSS
jgi:hypothetical protein